MKMLFTRTFAVALVLILSATGLWAAGAEEEPAAAADKKYVTDPSTGKVVVAPQYGGTISIVMSTIPSNIDPYIVYNAGSVISGVNEKLGVTDWALDRDAFGYKTIYTPDFAIRGHLAESWEQSDPLTYVFKIRQGVRWHNKAPMNGRELTADDIVYSFERVLGLGDFTEAGPGAAVNPVLRNVASAEATDKYTLVVKLQELSLDTLKQILLDARAYILAPEVIEQYGDVTDWRNVVGTGPFELTDWVEGSSYTYVKNPDYWGYDEKYPENRLPYVDEFRKLISKENATILALLRSGKADYIGNAGGSQLRTVDAAMSLQRTNPEINLWPYSTAARTAFTFNVQIPPWNDVRVRHALQMALDLETINATYFQGWADPRPAGRQGIGLIGYRFPYEEWPEEIKQYYRYDPEGAEKLLDEAGYPRGADGIRFKTLYEHYEAADLDYYQIAMEYLRAIGIDVEVKVIDRATAIAYIHEHKQLGMIHADNNSDYASPFALWAAHSTNLWGFANVQDPTFDAMYDAVVAATTVEEQKRLAIEADKYTVENHWWIGGPRAPHFNVSQPWIIGYNGEIDGNIDGMQKFARLWIDHELKEAMGY